MNIGRMMLAALRLIAVSTLLFAWMSPTLAGCKHLDGKLTPELRQRLPQESIVPAPDMVSRVAALQPIYERLAKVAGIRPALMYCDDRIFNAQAMGSREQGAVIFYEPLVRFLDGQVDEIAAVMAHEFAHLVLDHARHSAAAVRDINRSAQQVAKERYRRTGNASTALADAERFGQIEVAKYSRFHEREADDKGFSLAVTLAGYSGDGSRNLARKYGKLPANERPAYLDTHPRWLERFNKADALTTNQTFLDQASSLLAAKHWQELAKLVDRWLAVVPDSGAAWYYKGRLILRSPPSRSAITRSFEQSLDRYIDNDTLGTRSQEDQAERDEAWYSLCSALFDEGYRRESISCSNYIRNNEKRERFRIRKFGEHHQLITSADGPPPNLLLARNPDGSKLITNDLGVAASRGGYAPAAPQWRAQRLP